MTMQIHRYIIVLLMLLGSLPVLSQREVTVKSFSLLKDDLSARTHPRNDGNDTPCALIKVAYPNPNAKFDGMVIHTEYRQSEYWVYVPDGAKRMTIYLPGTPTIRINFDAYGINQVQSKTTYSLEFNFPEVRTGLPVSFYLGAGMNALGAISAGASLGAYVGNFNIELDVHKPLVGNQQVYWQSDEQVPVSFLYKPSLGFGARLGYGIGMGSKMRLTPQVGIRELLLTETDEQDCGLSPAKGANTTGLTLDARIEYLVSRHFSLSLAPGYIVSVAESPGFKALREAQPAIGKWGKGMSLKVAACVIF